MEYNKKKYPVPKATNIMVQIQQTLKCAVLLSGPDALEYLVLKDFTTVHHLYKLLNNMQTVCSYHSKQYLQLILSRKVVIFILLFSLKMNDAPSEISAW